jgi:hypothetical protein
LSKNQRLKRTLSSDLGSSPFEKLLQELPTTTYIECDAGQEFKRTLQPAKACREELREARARSRDKVKGRGPRRLS